jgi:cystathionine beta-lyase
MPASNTKLIHNITDHKKYFGAVNVPIVKTSTFIYEKYQDFLDDEKEYHTYKTYARNGTITSHELEKTLKELDEADAAFVLSSGMMAISIALLSVLKTGDHLLISDATYKCTKRFVEEELSKFDITYDYYPPNDTDAMMKLANKNTKAIFLESVGSSAMEVQDIKEVVKFAKKIGACTIVDNTWATSLFYQPLIHGVDIAIQSLTKFINGYSDVIMGVICTNAKFTKQVLETKMNFGCIPSPEDCYMVLRSIRSLSTRLAHQQAAVLQIIDFLKNHKAVTKVFHPTCEDSHGHVIWKRDFKGATSLLSFTTKELEHEQLCDFIEQLKYFRLGLSWGGVESLIIPFKIAKARKFFDTLPSGQYFRIHIGLENITDLIDDLRNGLNKLCK